MYCVEVNIKRNIDTEWRFQSMTCFFQVHDFSLEIGGEKAQWSWPSGVICVYLGPIVDEQFHVLYDQILFSEEY